ncbi:hypothetical protein B0H14DRAFT_2735057 [Mycena olivaceomarginata]|nr:hypothetical protein B0H14DRAFT_2735057 [Mycena olivaceomarginata]
MLALRFAPILLLATSFVAAIPAPAGANVAKRSSTADVVNVFNTLKGSTDSILPRINSLVSSGTASDATVTPLISQLTTAFNTAQAKRQSDEDVAVLVAGIVTAVPPHIPALPGLIVQIDIARQELLIGLDVILAGVLTLVGGLYAFRGRRLLKSLGLGLVLLLLSLGL